MGKNENCEKWRWDLKCGKMRKVRKVDQGVGKWQSLKSAKAGRGLRKVEKFEKCERWMRESKSQLPSGYSNIVPPGLSISANILKVRDGGLGCEVECIKRRD